LGFKVAPIKPSVTIDEVTRIDIRVGTIRSVTDVAGSTKLARLTVDFGDRERTILAGIRKERPDPREMEGRQALFVLNLVARRMAGEVSEGMLLDVGYANGITPVLAVPERPVPNGAQAG